ncbi:bifunctional 5,10-methylenetetrahydrofolate dehydrogenase/5,10-methenyltetrahydrofolate cyclohydrolase [Patescibacteria group bacterium]|nr:bifunctional 5,10-methylenetetrahydrofolate dehydrogenase/5,10-methenyltetrahydrofolate cyclohydrolase [Patescibacteria group bacterium]
MQKIPGKHLANQITAELKEEIKNKQLNPKLAALLVGDDQASHIYVNLKEKAAHDIGIETDFRRLPADTPDDELVKIIQDWNQDESITGILVQMPLPPGHDKDKVLSAMDPEKDADGFHSENIKALESGHAKLISPLLEGILRLIAATPKEPNHALVVILANSHIFADPLKYILEKAGASVKVVLADEKEDKELREADVIIVAVGKEKFLTSNGVKDGSCVIDVGINRNKEGKVCGDFDSEACVDIEGWYSPVPGGVGPMTVALLMKNVVRLADKIE